MSTKLAYPLIVILCLVFGFSLTTLYFVYQNSPTTISSPKTTQTQESAPIPFSWTNPPSASLRGQIEAISGEVTWQSRTATTAAALVLPHELLQGETLITTASGKIKATFPEVVTFTQDAATQLDIIQTLPSEIVFSQLGGLVDYQTLGDLPVSVRINPLLIRLGSGQMQVAVSASFITVKVSSGSAELAFNDFNYQITKLSIDSGHEYQFRPATRRGRLL